MSTKKNNKSKSGLLILLLVVLLIVGIFFIMKPKNEVPEETDDDKYVTYFQPASSIYTNEWSEESNVAQVVEDKKDGIRDKYTQIIGNNKDKVTIMVYMCGSDLESDGSMATYDLQEMAMADLSDNINLIIYTGGCTRWHIDGISNKYNQIYQITGDGNIYTLVDNAGTSSMVDPNNLVSFIEFCTENFEANRYELILWDHGGGTISGYGHDTKYPNAGSMTLDKIDAALTEADVYFDFVGFDACLMATTENALMLSEHADYLIASEESEPGIGWYYTTWLNTFSKNTSMSTVEVGKAIADSFVSTCASQTPNQPATLSVVDLAELQATIPAKLTAFAKNTTDLINAGQYKDVSKARGSSREFGTNANADMVDLVDLSSKFAGSEAKDLQKALLSCIKYNNTTRTMSNSYGLSIFFPYRSTRYVNTVLQTYKNINMDTNYSDCIKSFASYQTSGQISSGGSHNPYSLFGDYSNYYSDSYSQQSSSDGLYDLFSYFLTGGYQNQSSYSNYYTDDYSWLFSDMLFGRSIPEYIAENHFDADLTWKDGKISLTKEQWDMVNDLKLNVFIDDGNGYIDLGKDSIYEIDNKGNLLKQDDLTWVAASIDNTNWQVVPYYYTSTYIENDKATYYGRIPVLLNKQLANLIVKIDDESMEVIGASYQYADTTISAKEYSKLKAGDEIEFVCDYYDYSGNFSNTYVLGNKVTVSDKVYLGDVDISDYKSLVSYEFVDLYQQSYYSTIMK